MMELFADPHFDSILFTKNTFFSIGFVRFNFWRISHSFAYKIHLKFPRWKLFRKSMNFGLLDVILNWQMNALTHSFNDFWSVSSFAIYSNTLLWCWVLWSQLSFEAEPNSTTLEYSCDFPNKNSVKLKETPLILYTFFFCCCCWIFFTCTLVLFNTKCFAYQIETVRMFEGST